MKGKEAKSTESMYTILVVEDDESLNRLIQKKLKREGFRTEQALNGAEAISKVLETPNVVLLLDYLLPDMTGKELLIALARRKRRVPFIVMTGHGDEKIAVEMMKRGARDYMTKGPEFLDVLPQVVRHVIGELTTERKLVEVEDALREREKEHQTILDSVPVGIFHIDSGGRFVHVNEALAKRYGMKPEDFKGKSSRELFPEDADAFVKSDREVLESGEPQIGKIRKLTTPEGERWARLDKVPLKDDEGNVTGVIGFELDVTEQKQSEDLYRAIFENTGTGMIILEEDATISYVNAEMKNVWGYSKEEIEGKAKWTKFVVEADLERMMGYHRLRRIAPESAPTSYEFRFIHKNGEVRDASLAAAMIPGTKKSIISLKDITGQKRMGEELRQSEAMHRTIFESTGLPTVILNGDGTFYRVNAEGAKISGFSREELEGKKSLTEFIARKEDLEMMREIHRLRREDPDKVPKNYEFLFRDRYGNLRNIYVTAEVIPGTKKSVVSFLDLTDMKKAERDLKIAHQRVLDILEFLPDATFAIDKDKKVIAWNRAIEEMTGVKKEEIMGKGDYAYAVPFYGVKRPLLIDLLFASEEEIKTHYRSVNRRGDTLFAEVPLPHMYGGRGGYFWGTATPLYDSEGNVIGAIESIRDVTDKKKAEEAMQRTFEQFKTVMDSMDAYVYVADMENHEILFANKLMRDMFGDVVGKICWQTLQPGQTGPCPYCTNDRLVLPDGTPAECYVWEFFNKDANIIVECHDQAIRWVDGRLVRLEIAYDVTQRKQMERELAESEEQLNLALAGANLGVWDWNIVTNEVTCTGRWEDILGYSPEELTGDVKTWAELTHPDDLPKMMETLEDHLAGKTPFHESEHRMRHKDGRWIWLYSKGEVVARDETGSPLRLIGIKQDVTDRKRAEKELKASEERSRLLLNQLPAVLWTTDTELRFTSLLGSGVPKTGLPSDQVVGRTLYERLSTQDGGDVSIDVHQQALKGKSINYEEKLRDRIYHAHIEPLRDAEGEIVGTLGVAFDVTERKQAEETLRETRDYLENLINYANAPIIVWDREYKITRFNNAFEHLTGYTAGEVIGQELKMLFPEASRAESLNKIARTLSGEYWESVEIPILRKDGDVRIALWNSANIYAEDGKTLLATVAQGHDVTDRKLAEETVKESEEKYRMLVDNVQDGIFILQGTPAPTLVFCNEAFAKMAGYTMEEMMQLTIQQYVAPEDLKRVAENYQRRQAGEDVPPEYEYRVMHKDGRRIYVNMTAGLINYQGEVATLGTVKDVTERKQAEKKLLELINDLEIANRELRDFAYVVSHDLKTPLRAIHTLSDWLSSDYADKLDDKGQEYLDLLRNRAKRMHALIEGILQYSRLGRVAESKEEVDLNTLVSDVIDLINPQENIKIDVADELPTLYCDGTRMGEVFQNLLSNALKYMDKPEGRVTIGCTEEDKYWKFSVADNGPGIGEQYHEKIFQIFQMLHPRDEIESTGIGLTIVKKIVEMQGGKIWVESKAGEGSTFFFTIPKESRVSSSKTTA